MADKKTLVKTDDAETAPVDSTALIAQTLAQLVANQPRRKKAFHEVVHDSPWWDGTTPKSVLKHDFYQNGNPVNEAVLSNAEIDLINQLKHGVYAKNKFRVTKMPNQGIGLWYDNKSLKQRFDIARMAGEDQGLTGILQLILTEAEAQKDRRKRGLDIDGE
jgi:hypothetical protein